jgi:hypothetical protein
VRTPSPMSCSACSSGATAASTGPVRRRIRELPIRSGRPLPNPRRRAFRFSHRSEDIELTKRCSSPTALCSPW